MNELIRVFLEMVAGIRAEKPAYHKTGDGSKGLCDCIGLIIGAIRRMGLKWTGIHGSNYAARKAMVGLLQITSLDQLRPGHVVYKAYSPGEAGYNLPSRYKKGGAYYNGDLKDYYHVGVVTGVNPLVITHMTSPTVKTLTVKSMSGLGRWGYFGQIKPVYDAGGRIPGESVAPVGSVDTQGKEKDAKAPEALKVPSEGSQAVVVSGNGQPVKMRTQPSVKCRDWVKLSVGTVVVLVAPGEKWAKIRYGKQSGYMMAEFLDVI